MSSHDDATAQLGAADASAIRKLVEEGADIHALFNGRTLLMQKARSFDVDSVRLLLELGADVHAVDKHGANVLHVLVQQAGLIDDEPAVEILQLLVEAGIDANERQNNGRTALHRAVGTGQIRALVEAGADVNAMADCQPIHLAAAVGSLERVQTLVELGAEYDRAGWVHQTKGGSRTPLDEARTHHNHKVAKYLRGLLGVEEAGDPWESLLTLAKNHGEAALESAWNSGDCQSYKDMGLDLDILGDEAWDALYKRNIEEAIGALDDDERAALPGTSEEQFDQLFYAYLAPWRADE